VLSLRMDAALVWFRRDLRMNDHAALSLALRSHARVYCVFVFDTDILAALPTQAHRRVEFIHGSLVELDTALRSHGGGLIVAHGRSPDEIARLAVSLGASVVYANRDYEPAAIKRDDEARARLQQVGVAFRSTKDQVVFERDELLSQAGKPFSVFTPYKNAWLAKIRPTDVANLPVARFAKHLSAPPTLGLPTLREIGFESAGIAAAGVRTGASGAQALVKDFNRRIDAYHERRDYPAVKGPSYLSVHLRFGTISIRGLARSALANPSDGARTWLTELIWRDFYFMILAQHPHVVQSAFRPEYDRLVWENNETDFAAWCEGRTGYPIVDAAMRQLNQTGYMHNRLRMIVASFLTKDLGIDWRWGERYFAAQLIDHDLAANNGGWQWAASTGCDAQPYFRIFNPLSQSERFDPDGKFIRRYVPELARVPAGQIHAPWLLSPIDQQAFGCVVGRDYPAPIVDHAVARKLTLERYTRARSPSLR
jgi:deoxyribodipyrimidine photo-lyase